MMKYIKYLLYAHIYIYTYTYIHTFLYIQNLVTRLILPAACMKIGAKTPCLPAKTPSLLGANGAKT